MSQKKIDERSYSVTTQLIYGKSVTGVWDYSHHLIPPVTTSSTFRLDSARRGAEGFQSIGQYKDGDTPIYIYDRMGEPNSELLQHALATAEDGEVALTFSTGMAAVHAAVANFVNAGDEIISHSTIYGCTYSMFSSHLSRFGVKTHFVDLRDPARLAGKINQKTRVVYLESPVNPNLDLLDLEALANQVKAANAARKPDAPKIICIVDNTFATPWCQRPLQFGVDLVVHSLTKGISGFGVDMGGAIITRKEFYQPLCLFRKDFGSFLAPNEAWRILNFGVSTLALRVPRQQDNALKVAKFLESHPKVARVSYPGLDSFPQSDLARKQMRSLDGSFAPGFVLYFVLAGEPEAAKAAGERMMDFVAENAYAITLAVSLGQLRTLIEHPGSMTHVSYAAAEQISLGIDPGGIRISVGIEDPSDIVRDLAAALATV